MNFFFFLRIRRPPRSTPKPSSAASDVYKRQQQKALKKALKRNMGVLALPVGSGKTIIGLRLIYELNLSTLIIVHTKELLYQWADNIREVLGIEPGLVGDNNWDEKPVTVAMIQTLLSRGVDKLQKPYAVLLFDECHRTSAAEKFYELGISLTQKLRFGLSATPWRRIRGEELKIEGVVGPIIYEIKAEDLIKEKFLAKPRFVIIEYESSMPPLAERYKELYEEIIMENKERNKAIVRIAYKLAKQGHRVLIDVKRIQVYNKKLKEAKLFREAFRLTLPTFRTMPIRRKRQQPHTHAKVLNI